MHLGADLDHDLSSYRRAVHVILLAVLLPLGLQLFFGNVTHTPFPSGSWGIFPALN